MSEQKSEFKTLTPWQQEVAFGMAVMPGVADALGTPYEFKASEYQERTQEEVGKLINLGGGDLVEMRDLAIFQAR